MANIPNKADGQVLNAAELFKIVGSDNSGGSHTGDTNETTKSTINLTANQVNEGMIIRASISFSSGTPGAGLYTGTFRIKVAGVTKQTVTIQSTHQTDGAAFTNGIVGGMIEVVDSTSDFTGSLAVTVTVQNANAGNTCVVNSVVITGS